MPAYVKVAKSSEIDPGTGRLVEAGGKRIAIFNVDGNFHAMDETCTHRGGPLSEGMLIGKEVTCPWHGAVFDVTFRRSISTSFSCLTPSTWIKPNEKLLEAHRYLWPVRRSCA